MLESPFGDVAGLLLAAQCTRTWHGGDSKREISWLWAARSVSTLILSRDWEQVPGWRCAACDAVDVDVVPLVPMSDAKIERAIAHLVSESRRFRDASLNVTVEKGRVTVRGTFREPDDVVFLKHRLAEIEGATAIEMAIEFQT